MTIVSIVIPTYNRLESLKRVLSALEQQTVPSDTFEVVVVSDGATDGTHEYLCALNKPYSLKYVFQPNQGVAVARNNGIANASGQFILFLDDDVVPTPELVSEHLRYHEIYGTNVVVIGPMLSPPEYTMSPWVRWEQEKLAGQYQEMQEEKWQPTARQFYTGNTSLARRWLSKDQCFDPSFRRAEDVELAFRLADRGVCFVFNPRAIGYHYAERSLNSWLAIPYAYGCNDVIFTYQKGRPGLLGLIFTEFYQRHPLIQASIRLCLDRPNLSRAVNKALITVLNWEMRVGMKGKSKGTRLTSLACSWLFNLQYYQGIADGLQGRAVFLEGLKERRRENRHRILNANAD